MNKAEYRDIMAFHPGYYLKDIIGEAMMSQDELAKRLGISAKHVSEIVNGKVELTDDMAHRLSVVLGTSAELWTSLTHTWQQKKTLIARREKEERETAYLQRLDYGYWVRLGVAKETMDTGERIDELCRYLKVSSLETLDKKDFLVQYRAARDIDAVDTMNANAWVQTAINIGNKIETKPYCGKEFRRIVGEILHIMREEKTVSEHRLRKLLAECGIAFVSLPYLKRSEVFGAVKWLGKDKVLLAICDSLKSADEFWDALLHELGHVKQKRITKLIVIDKKRGVYSPDDARIERDADNFVKAVLAASR
jgi:HTH-type transcriptional regulator/antitoxin HigA